MLLASSLGGKQLASLARNASCSRRVEPIGSPKTDIREAISRYSMLADTVLSAMDIESTATTRESKESIAALRDHKSSTWRTASARTARCLRARSRSGQRCLTVPIGDP